MGLFSLIPVPCTVFGHATPLFNTKPPAHTHTLTVFFLCITLSPHVRACYIRDSWLPLVLERASQQAAGSCHPCLLCVYFQRILSHS